MRTVSLAICATLYFPLGGCAKPHDSTKSHPRITMAIEQSGHAIGEIVIELDEQHAPITVRNFMQYIDDGYYNGTLIHRVTVGPRIHVLQGGGYTALNAPNKPGQHPAIKLESDNGLKNVRGTIAMARDTAPATATSEFFINIQDNPRLNYTGPDHLGYCVFGHIVAGIDVMDRIAHIETRINPDPELHGEKSQPVDPPVVRSARRR